MVLMLDKIIVLNKTLIFLNIFFSFPQSVNDVCVP